VEYLLDWSRGLPIYVVGLARPEFADKRPTWGGGRRAFTSLYLEPLPSAAMDQLLTGLVPGLPDDLRERILDRAEGIPLYAVETVRMLLDRGLVERAGHVYRATGEVGSLEVPETLHALVAARLDSLSADERRLVESGAVLGKTFTKQGLAAVSGVSGVPLDALLGALLSKEIFSVQADPRSPERGQYAFLQDIVKRVAYDTISRRERKAKHLAAAEFLASGMAADEDEIAEVIAAHYLDAFNSAPNDADAPALRERAFETFVRAAERAAALGANIQAQRAFERAAGLTDDVQARAELLERAGIAAYVGAGHDAERDFTIAIELFESIGATHAAARVAARVAEISWEQGRIEQGLESMDAAFAVLSEDEPDADLAALAAQHGRFMLFAGQAELAIERIDRALSIAEQLWLPETLAHALNTKGVVLYSFGRFVEGQTLVRRALDLALESDKPSAALRAYYNLADQLVQDDRLKESAAVGRDGLELARRVGNRYWEWSLLGNAYSFFALGEWDEVTAREQLLPEGEWTHIRIAFATLLTSIVPLRLHRGQRDDATRYMSLFAELETSADTQERSQVLFAKASVLFAEGRYDEALQNALAAFEQRHTMSVRYEAVKEAFVVAVDAALALGDLAQADRLLGVIEALPPGQVTPFLRSQRTRFRARLAEASGDTGTAEELFVAAAEAFRDIGFPFYLAVTLLEHAELLQRLDRPGEAAPRSAQAREVFQQLGAAPWVARATGSA
jgi:tetratricopeptide (TPR) repeat protein